MYRWDAEEYRDASSQQKRWGRELAGKLGLLGGERVLDIGCGDGMLAAEMAALVPGGSVVGIDSSPEMIRFAGETFPPGEYGNLTWEVKDAAALDYENEFDVVFSNAVLHWIMDQIPVVEGIARALKPGGRALLQMGGKGNVKGISGYGFAVLSRPEWSACFTDFEFPYRFHGPEEYRVMIERAGLECRRAELVSKDMVQEGREGLASWIRTTWLPVTERIPEDLRERCIFEVVDGYIEDHPADPEGLVHVDAVRLEVEAVKPPRAPDTSLSKCLKS